MSGLTGSLVRCSAEACEQAVSHELRVTLRRGEPRTVVFGFCPGHPAHGDDLGDLLRHVERVLGPLSAVSLLGPRVGA